MKLDCRQYLETVLPGLVKQTSELGRAAGRVVQFLVMDVADCDYFYVLGRDGLQVHKGVSDQVDLSISCMSEDLVALFSGTLDVKRSILHRRLRLHGDEQLLGVLAGALRA